jgi:hypothetical protein
MRADKIQKNKKSQAEIQSELQKNSSLIKQVKMKNRIKMIFYYSLTAYLVHLGLTKLKKS